jgi:undecaprenyl pyrophosphate phosphatase UppP
MSNSPYLNLFIGFATALLSDLVCGDWLFSFVMRKRFHRIAIIGMLVTAILGASLAIRDIIHPSIAPDSSIAH